MTKEKVAIRLFLFLVILSNGRIAFGQLGDANTMPTIGSPIPVSPNAAALGKYGEIPVGFYTGIPNINLPLYEIKTGSLDLPISLSYHAGGVRVEEIASWAGLGWSLNAGGVISRQLRGIADEAGGGYLSDYHTLNQLLDGSLSSEDQLAYFQDVEKGLKDSQQDIFTYSAGGESGKFILDSTSVGLTIPASRNKFELITYNGSTHCWKMTDIHGIQYFFADKETTTMTPVTNNSLSSHSLPATVTSWYLSKVVNAQGNDSINFVYTVGFHDNNSSIAQTKYVFDPINSFGTGCGPKSTDSKYSQSSTIGVTLSQIIFKNGIIRFTTQPGTRCDMTSDVALASIEIRNTDSSFDKIYRLYQHYSSATGTVICDLNDEENNRLVLDSLQFSDAVGGNTGKYLFGYDSTRLPSRLSYSQDHWGFFNGAQNAGDFVPSRNIINGDLSVSFIPGANRNPNSTKNQAGILRSITYPTGGKTEFEYESNTAANYSSFSAAGADVVVGNRVFVIGSVPLSKHMDTTFVQGDDFAGLGGVNASISIVNGGGDCATESSFSCPIVTLTGPSGTAESILHNGTQFLPKGTYHVHIDLRTVTDPDIISNFEFGIIWSFGASTVDSLKFNTAVGGLRVKRITEYAADNVKTNVRSYNYLFPDSAYHSSGFMLNFPEYSGSITNNIVTHFGETDLIASCIYNTYSSNSNYPLASTQSSYVGYKYVEELLGENGEFGKNVYQFQAPDAVPDLGNVNIFPYAPATSQDWKRGQTLHVQSYRYDSTSGTYQLISEKTSAYGPLVTDIYSGYQIGRNVFYASGVTDGAGLDDYQSSLFGTQIGWLPLTSDINKLYDQNNLSSFRQTTTSYTYSNVHFQPISVSEVNSKGDTITSYMSYPLDYTGLTGTDPFTKGVAALQSANIVTPTIEKYVQRRSSAGTLIGTTQALLTTFKSNFLLPDTIWSTQFASPSLSFSPLSVEAGSLVKDGGYVPQIAYLRYDVNANPVEQQKLHDLRQSFLWDYKGTNPICQVTNADSASIAYTSFEADGTGNWTIGSSARDTTTGITGTKSYHLSSDISKSGLTSGTTYYVSYWTRNSSAFSISGTIAGYPVKGKTVTINGNSWILFVHKVTGQTTIALSGSGLIDELRLYPATAQMTTYTYSPLVGMTSQCDAGNRITYYEYDGLARLKRVRDQDYNILKSLEYQYQASSGCGGNCYSIVMQTFAGTNTLGYPVGVFGVQGNLLGNATNTAGYISLWNADSADAHIGTLAAGKDSLHFNITLNSGQTMPAGVTGCRYYQYDLAWNQLDGIQSINAEYVTFGDSTGMYLGKTRTDTPTVLAPNTTVFHLVDQFDNQVYFEHTYPDTSLKTLTFYHSDGVELNSLDDAFSPAPSLYRLKNFRGNMPQNATDFAASSYQEPSALTVSAITNWNSIHSIINFTMNNGDKVNPVHNISYAQDFMANNKGLQNINLSGDGDTTFKLSRIKTDWNTYFTGLQRIVMYDYCWNAEDISALTQLSLFEVVHITTTASSSEINNIINQLAAGAAQQVHNGRLIWFCAGVTPDTSSSAFHFLKTQGWTININGVLL